MLKVICEPYGADFDVMPCDELPNFRVRRFPLLLVVNTVPAPADGHWCAFFMRGKRSAVEFFDAFAMPPDFYNDYFREFIERISGKVRFMPRPLQCFNTNFRGQHCLHYLYNRIKGKSIPYIYKNIFRSGCRRNDRVSANFVMCFRNRMGKKSKC